MLPEYQILQVDAHTYHIQTRYRKRILCFEYWSNWEKIVGRYGMVEVYYHLQSARDQVSRLKANDEEYARNLERLKDYPKVVE